MRVYFDTNVICRPFDDQSQEKIANEIAVITKMFVYIGSRMFDVVISDVVLAELTLIKNPVITHPINGWLDGYEPSQRRPVLKSTLFLLNLKFLLMCNVFLNLLQFKPNS